MHEKEDVHSKEEPEFVSVQNMVREDNESPVEVDKDLFSILDVKESGSLTKEKTRKRIYSPQRGNQETVKQTKYTIRMYDSEYEILKTQAHQLNITIQLLIDFLLVDGFIKRDKRVIEFLNERLKEMLFEKQRGFNKIDQFSNLEIDEIVSKIEADRLKEDE